jgi:hypothetical protein
MMIPGRQNLTKTILHFLRVLLLQLNNGTDTIKNNVRIAHVVPSEPIIWWWCMNAEKRVFFEKHA